MTIFISYARANQLAAEQLRDDVERCHREAWLDRELTGGQSWWKSILQNIRECDVFLVALSSEWVQSTACGLELSYAIALQRPVLPVMVTRIDPRLAPPAIVDAQILDYLRRSPETIFALRDALDTLPSAPPLPSPLPPEPAAPISYLHNIIVMLNAPSLDRSSQYELWRSLQGVLDEADGDDRLELLKLVRRLRKRRDLIPQLQLQIDAVLGGPPTPPYPPPALALDQRTLPPTNPEPWTAPTQVLSPPKRPGPPPARSRRRLLWAGASTGVLLLALSIWIGIAVVRSGNSTGTENPLTQTTTETPSITTTTTTTTTTSRRTTTTAPMQIIIPMPDFTGQTPDRAKKALASLNWHGEFRVKTIKVSEQGQDGLILEQAPKGGTKVTDHAQVDVTVGQFEATPMTTPPPIK